MADYENYGWATDSISVGPNGELSLDSIANFREIAAEGNRDDLYAYAAAHGSDYGKVGVGYHGDPQSLSGRASDAYTTFRTLGEFRPGNELYNRIADGLMQDYAAQISRTGRMPTTTDIFTLHLQRFANEGIPGKWMGTTFSTIVDFFMGREPWDPPQQYDTVVERLIGEVPDLFHITRYDLASDVSTNISVSNWQQAFNATMRLSVWNGDDKTSPDEVCAIVDDVMTIIANHADDPAIRARAAMELSGGRLNLSDDVAPQDIGNYPDLILRVAAGITTISVDDDDDEDEDDEQIEDEGLSPTAPEPVYRAPVPEIESRSGQAPNDPGYDGPQPILLDLDGNGIRITEQSRSGVFVDAGGDGLKHRTAWAGAGDGVLFYDPDGTGAITEKRQYVFTEWGERRKRNGPVDRFRQRTRRAPTATDDYAAYLAALHHRRLSVVSKGALS